MSLVTVELQFLEGLTKYIAQQKADRGRSESATLKRLMKYWLSYAMADVPRADAAAIRLYLLAKTVQSSPATTRRKRSAQRQLLQQTMAMAIVIKTNYKGESGRKASDINGVALLNLVNKYINARAFSAGLHRAGFLPALQLLRSPSGQKLPKYKHPPGRVDIINDPETFGITVTNFAKIIATLAPNAFAKATKDLETNMLQWTRQNQTADLRSAGLDAA